MRYQLVRVAAIPLVYSELTSEQPGVGLGWQLHIQHRLRLSLRVYRLLKLRRGKSAHHRRR
jgi:hypothetical protein